MSKARDKRSKQSKEVAQKKQLREKILKEKVITELSVKLDRVLELQEKAALEKRADKVRQDLRIIYQNFLEMVNELKLFTRKGGVEQHILASIDALEQRTIIGVKHFITLTEINMDKVSDFNIDEILNNQKMEEEFFSEIMLNYHNIYREVLSFIVEDEKKLFEEYSLRLETEVVRDGEIMMETILRLENVAYKQKVNKNTLQKIAPLKTFILNNGKRLLVETRSLKQVPEKPGANREFKEGELNRVLAEVELYRSEYNKNMDLILNEIEPHVAKKKA